MTILKINGSHIFDLHRYVVRWVKDGEQSVPTLYQDGKRVTKAWSLHMEADSAPDEKGASANTT